MKRLSATLDRTPVALGLLAVIVAMVLASVVFAPPQRHAPVKPSQQRLASIALKNAMRAAEPKPAKPKPVPAGPTEFQKEQQMSHRQLMKRWDPTILKAAKRFGVPQTWIRAVMTLESGGRTMLEEGLPITSTAGAMGLMQLMPSTYDEMRGAYGLGDDPYDPHDNIMAGAAYLRWLRGRYGYPTMFAAYNDGPGNLEQRMRDGHLLPAETRLYLADITDRLEGGKGGGHGMAQFTRPNGSPILIDCTLVRAVRSALPEEYAPTVRTVVTVGKVKQGVREETAQAKMIIRAHGGPI